MADAVAENAAENVQIPKETSDGINYVHAAHRRVMARAVQAYKLALEATTPSASRSLKKEGPSGRFLLKEKVEPRAPWRTRGPQLLDIPALLSELEELGHLVVQGPSSISCSLCLRRVEGARIEGWVAEGPCVGSRAPHLGLYARLRRAGYDLTSGPTDGPSCVVPPCISSNRPGGEAACTTASSELARTVPNEGTAFVDSGTAGVSAGSAEMDSDRESIFACLAHPDECPVIPSKKDLDFLNPPKAPEELLEVPAGPIAGQASSSASGGPACIIEIRPESPESSKPPNRIDNQVSSLTGEQIRYRLRTKTKDPLSEERVLSILEAKPEPNPIQQIPARNTIKINSKLGSFSKKTMRQERRLCYFSTGLFL